MERQGMPRYINVDPSCIDPNHWRGAAGILLKGGVAAGPTETLYGLLASASSHDALDRVMAMKGRDPSMPLLLLIDRPERALCYARELPETAEELIRRFWPGPLTLLLRARSGLHESLIGPARTVGVRVVGLPGIRMLVRVMDRAVTGTSANPTGMPAARTAAEAATYFGTALDLVMDGGPTPGGLSSTIVDASTGRLRLIRDGAIGLDALMAVAPDLRT